MNLPSVSGKIPAQTLFLGASITNINTSVGWGGGSSTLQVELVEDFQPTRFANVPHYTSYSYSDNHYYTCVGDNNCYVDELGRPYNSDRPPFVDGMRDDPKEKNVPGKIYYEWVNNQFVSKYWILEDPGFFATGTKIAPDGSTGSSRSYIYDIINTPVYFKFSDFEFIGLVKSWERNNKPGGITYTVNLESFDNILEGSYVILDSYAGSIFGKTSINKGSPISLINSSSFTYEGLLSEGNIPNIFNVYGFLESFGINNFGGSNRNDNGLRAIDILKGLSILTSSKEIRENDKPFSPFGRLLSKSLSNISPPAPDLPAGNNTIVDTILKFGIIPRSVGTNRYPTGIDNLYRIYNTFSLDISDISNIIPDFRISGSQSIMDIIRVISENSGKEFVTKVVPAYDIENTLSQFIIKIIAIDKTSYQDNNRIKNIITSLENQNYKITNSSFGQESNENDTYKFLIGGPQQRLYQVKNYRLSFNQTSYIYNPITKTFINLNKPWNKARIPDVFSTRNNIISQYIFGETNSNRLNIQDIDRGSRFNCDGIDNVWSDNEVTDGTVGNKAIRGNYQFTTTTNITNNINGSYGDYYLQTYNKYPCDVFAAINSVGPSQYLDINCSYDFPNTPCPAKNFSEPACITENPAQSFAETLANYNSNNIIDGGNIGVNRFFNLQNDWICPYFGRTLEDSMPVNDDTNEFRRPRPVFLDTWTNQLCVGFSLKDLPALSIGEPLSLYDNPSFPSGFGNNSTNMQGLQRTSFSQNNTNPRASGILPPSRRANTIVDGSVNPVLKNIRRSVLNRPGFTVKETEMRSALVGFDSYLSYCLGKSHFSKPDLFLMLATAYAAKGELFMDPKDFDANPNIKDDSSGLTRKHAVPKDQNIIKYGITTLPETSLPSKIKFNGLLNHNFIKDLKIIHEFIKKIADTYYGKQYLVKIPEITIYSDQQYATLQIKSKHSAISVYGGSKKLFYSYELSKSGAWEEPGNFIDDCMVIGDGFSKVFTNDEGLIDAIVGYNNSVQIDDIRKRWCELDAINKTRLLFNNLSALADREISNQYQNIVSGSEVDMNTNPNYQRNRLDSLRNTENILRFVIDNTVRQYGASFSCVPGLTERLLNQSWNSVWQTSNEGANDNSFANSLDCLGGESSFANNWARMINNVYSETMNWITGNSFTLPSLDYSSLSDDFVIVPVDNKKEPFNNRSVKASKLFAKCETDKIIFMNISSFTDARVIMKVNQLDTFNSSNSYEKDPNLTVIANIAIEDLVIYEKLRPGTLAKLNDPSYSSYDEDVEYLRVLRNYIVPELDPRFIINTGPKSNPSSTNHDFLAAKTAHPHFFAIPLKSNQFCYGPWVNFPDLIIGNSNIINNNMIHKVKVEQNNDLVPWNYGNASLLDSAAQSMIGADSHYQTILENGSVSIVGMPIFGIGGTFSSRVRDNSRNFNFVYDNNYYTTIWNTVTMVDIKLVGQTGSSSQNINYETFRLDSNIIGFDGPIISNITLQIGNDNIITSYRFQTYSPKTGLYNKEYTDALKSQAAENNKFNKAIATLNNKISTQLTTQINKIFDSAKVDRKSTDVSKLSSRLFGNSPTELIVGQARELLKNPLAYSNLDPLRIRDPGDNPIYDDPSNNDNTKLVQFLNNKSHYHWAGMIMGDETLAELQQDYDCKSAMSLDGLLSPVSYYPTRNLGTYSISTLLNGSGIPLGSLNADLVCPLCRNTKNIPINYLNYNRNSSNRGNITEINIPCPVCSRGKINVKTNDRYPDRETGLPDINYKSLCPVVVSTGEFRNPYASGIDRGRDSINVVAYGKFPKNQDSNWTPTNRNSYNNRGKNPDYDNRDTNNTNELNNKRFFALRGPLMMHGWGFDTDGYPVPNALDMPYSIDDKGRLLRFQINTSNDPKKLGFNDLEKCGSYEISTSAPILGDIITKRYEWKGTLDGIGTGVGKWVKKSKSSKKFYLNWAERPDLWPVGPIDLRWDNERRVWDASGGCKEEILPPFIISNKNDLSTLNEFLNNRTNNKCPYKMIYITLEQDMIREGNFESTIPARAFIDDIEYSKEPLQNTYRRLVYVIDNAGYTAPKGAKLLCRYNRDNGFYEPITKPILTALGTINGNQASIQMSYVQGRRSGVLPTFSVTFANPLGLKPANKGLFNYINGQWTLVSTG